jgi:hypothetical protein
MFTLADVEAVNRRMIEAIGLGDGRVPVGADWQSAHARQRPATSPA